MNAKTWQARHEQEDTKVDMAKTYGLIGELKKKPPAYVTFGMSGLEPVPLFGPLVTDRPFPLPSDGNGNVDRLPRSRGYSLIKGDE
jgi:hypothetical protein